MTKIEYEYKVFKTTTNGRTYEFRGTLSELIKCFQFTLKDGDLQSYKLGNKKINKNPNNIESLLINIYNAEQNTNRCTSNSYNYEIVDVK